MSHRSRRLASTTCGGQCNKAIKEKEDESIQCDKCQLWYHQKCTDIPMEAMKYFELVKGIRWFCDSCTNPVKVLLDNGDSNKEITKVVESISELKNEIVDIKAKLNYVSRENEPKIEPPGIAFLYQMKYVSVVYPNSKTPTIIREVSNPLGIRQLRMNVRK